MLGSGSAQNGTIHVQWRLVAPGMVLVVGCGTPITASYIQAAVEDQAAHIADVRGTEHLQLARELPANPPDVVVALTEFIGEGGPSADAVACLMFSPAAADQLDARMDVASCPAVIEALHGQVTDRGAYINAVTVPADSWSTNGDTGTINGCEVTWNGLLVTEPLTPPGPFVGDLTLTRQDGKGWLITGDQGC
jgi:hypothetical protein